MFDAGSERSPREHRRFALYHCRNIGSERGQRISQNGYPCSQHIGRRIGTRGSQAHRRCDHRSIHRRIAHYITPKLIALPSPCARIAFKGTRCIRRTSRPLRTSRRSRSHLPIFPAFQNRTSGKKRAAQNVRQLKTFGSSEPAAVQNVRSGSSSMIFTLLTLRVTIRRIRSTIYRGSSCSSHQSFGSFSIRLSLCIVT